MSEVPDDLMKVAREVADDHDAKMKALYGPTASTRHAYMIELIAVALAAERERATLAERERCAAIVADQLSKTMEFYQPGGERGSIRATIDIIAEKIARP